jgi:4-hydroxyphenylacetate 3-hydroxylase, reductase component
MKAPAPVLPVPAGIDEHAMRHTLGRFATGVTIVTTLAPDGTPVGLTVNSFNSLSLDPPLVLWSLRKTSHSLDAFRAAPRFAVNVLAESQLELSRVFASKAAHKFAGGPWDLADAGLPVLQGAAACFVCRTASHQVAGDHVLFIGEVLRLTDSHHAPLLFQGGRYRRLGPMI